MRARKNLFRVAIFNLEREFIRHLGANPTRDNQSLHDRVRRALSWLKRAAEISEEDRPPRFVDLWIAFNALYGTRHYGEDYSVGEYHDFVGFLSLLSKLSSGTERLVSLMQKRHLQGQVRDLIQNKYLWNDFWSGKEAEFQWESGKELERLSEALLHQAVETFYGCMFQRPKVLRNQIFHGSASADTRRNKDALVLAILILEELLPAFISLMIEHGQNRSWPAVPYPARRTALHPVKD